MVENCYLQKKRETAFLKGKKKKKRQEQFVLLIATGCSCEMRKVLKEWVKLFCSLRKSME